MRIKLMINKKTKELLLSFGYVPYKSETFNYFAKRSEDLLGFMDILALPSTRDGEKKVVGVQVTTLHNINERKKKILTLESAKLWLQSNNEIWIVGWYRKEGGREKWQYKIIKVSLSDFDTNKPENGNIERLKNANVKE